MRRAIFISVVTALFGSAASADHPGERLNEVTAEKEPGFEVVSQTGPDLGLITIEGKTLGLEEFAGRILVVNFRPDSCTETCHVQHRLLAETVTSLNASPMREMVSIVTVAESAADIDAPGAENWSVVRSQVSFDDIKAQLSAASERADDTPKIHLFDRRGRHVGIFHGAEFKPLNLLMHINGLTNAHPHPESESLLDKAVGWFE